jgi:fatty acid desaturase
MKDKRYPIRSWRPAFDILSCYLTIAVSILAAQYCAYLYPIAVLVIANRMFALSLLCHEGIHGNLAENYQLNQFLARWLCAFPVVASFSRYRRFHLLHHGAVGHPKHDPDRDLYSGFPRVGWRYFGNLIVSTMSLRTALLFFRYYTDIPDFLKSPTKFIRIRNRPLHDGDFLSFCLFLSLVLTAVIRLKLFTSFACFVLLPLYLLAQPYALLVGALQHGPQPEGMSKPELISRSIRGPKWSMEILLPLNINFHAEHHLAPSVPHYWLKSYSQDLESQVHDVWKESYGEAMMNLFTVPQPADLPVWSREQPLRSQRKHHLPGTHTLTCPVVPRPHRQSGPL